MSNLIGVRGVFGVVILSIISAFSVGGIIIEIFSSSSNQIDKIYLYLSFILSQGFIILPPICYLNFKKKSISKSFRIKQVSFNVIINSIIFSIGIIILFDALDRFINQIIPTPDYIINLGKIMQPDSTLGLVFLFLAIVVMAPIGEEIVFRGFLQKFLEEHWKDITKAVLVTSLFFAIIHFNPYWTIQIYLLGVILGFLSWKTKSVVPSIILHSINNGIAFILTISDGYNVNFYLLGNHVSPVFIIIAIYLSYYGMSKINQMNT